MIRYHRNIDEVSINLEGEFTNLISKIDLESLNKILNLKNIKTYKINLDFITKFDVSFIFFLLNYFRDIKSNGREYILLYNTPIANNLVNTLSTIEVSNNEIVRVGKIGFIKKWVKLFDNRINYLTNTTIDFMSFIGQLFYLLIISLIHPSKIRKNAISYHVYSGVITAMPIIFIVSFIVGGVIAYQGGSTLNMMGFIQLAVEMTAKLTLREIGPFVVALIVAGRSASSYTAQIGVMKITDELNAMKTMNFNLFNFIVIPRFIALVVSFPFMVFLSDLVSIFGCMVFLKFGFDISFADYIIQLKEGVGMNSFWAGMIKAPFYAATIVIVGCFVGFRVDDNTQSIGEKTTISVVYALFGVIVMNALFSLIFTELRF